MLYYLGIQERATKYRGVEQMVARRAHNPEVAGSSPVPATKSVTVVDTISATVIFLFIPVLEMFLARNQRYTEHFRPQANCMPGFDAAMVWKDRAW